ncbi:hypothetical protein GSY69_06345 [Brevibacterium sp. 5221]|uniref:D-inositol 3-phosphate glycosyltransferase n=1 Tax=Brevibacterium rongguiense TaxID=2695267 RepID=A0A6N9H6B2_9MICO|nr:hypothetical protein [Brevibacterium rongguiense]MYM19600.1 hypothetical protein [Brevibacterium rongguiense]
MSSPDAALALDGRTRILHVLTSAHTAIGEVARAAIAAQLEAGLAVAVAARPEVLAALELPASELLRTVPIAAAPGVRPSDAESALALHKRYRFVDVVHAHGLHAAALAGLACTGLPQRLRPALVATLGHDEQTGPIGSLEGAVVARTATAVLGTTEPICEHYEDRVPLVRRARLLRSELAREVAPRLSRARVREDLDVPAGAVLIAVPVRMADTPEFTAILEAAARLPEARGDRRWVVAFTGGGRAADTVAREFLPRFDHLRVEPQVSTVDTAAAADIVVAGTKLGGIDAAGLMQLRRPVVFVGSEQEARVWGPSIPRAAPGDTRGLLHELEELSDHPAQRVQDGFAARRRVVADERFDPAALDDVYARARIAAAL